MRKKEIFSRRFVIQNGIIVFCALLILAYVAFVSLSQIVFAGRFGVNILVSGVDISYLDLDGATVKAEEALSKYYESEVIINGSKYPVKDLVLNYSVRDDLERVLKDQNSNPWLFSQFFARRYSLNVNENNQAISDILDKNYDLLSMKAKDARVVVQKNKDLVFEEGITGQKVNLPESRENIIAALSNLESSAELSISTQSPVVTKALLENIKDKIYNATSKNVNIKYLEKTFSIKSDDLRSWVKISLKNPKSTVILEDILAVHETQNEYSYFEDKKVADFVESVAKTINISEKNAVLSYENNAVVIKVKDQVGKELNKADLALQVQENIVDGKEVLPRVAEKLAQVRSDNLAELGIKELVSTGWSDFKGSPVNRTHNVKTGASKFNGVLIKPDEEFSFNTTLGPVDASTGYLPELVILVDKTVPEYGGGMCQVSSTAFRAALNAGMPILERVNHSYPVQYYTPFGVDASIYLPKPDLVFKNDTGKYVLIQTRVEGTKLYFDFFGTKSTDTVKFSGNDKGDGAVENIEKVSPLIYDKEARGKGSFTAAFWRHNYDATGKFIKSDKFVSKYNSPDNYPH